MKDQFWRIAPRLRWSDAPWTLLPMLIWLGAIYSRSALIEPHCSIAPEHCTVASLLSMDRPAVGLEAGHADGLSFTTQGLSAIVALTVPLLWHLGGALRRQAGALKTVSMIGIDLALLAQTTVWNGLLTETAHWIADRPRPFVYMDPQRAKDFSNYTSFYSGHTSFSAAATAYVVLTLAARGAPNWVLAIAAAGSYCLMSLTGLYRVLAGRHFPSDVMIGALAGIVVAFVVAARHKPGFRWDRAMQAMQ